MSKSFFTGKPIYVRMTDSFLSGWGNASGLTNVYVIECDTRAQADCIEMAANRRSEMKRVQMVETHPRPRKNILYTDRHFNQLGGAWHLGYQGD